MPDAVKAAANYFNGPASIEQCLFDRVSADLFCKNIRSRDRFYDHLAAASASFISQGQQLRDRCLSVLKAYQGLRRELEKLKLIHRDNRGVQNFLRDLMEELERLGQSL